METRNVYLISGLGADKRLFGKLEIPANYTLVYIDWIPPYAEDSIYSYAKRLSTVIDSSRPFYLIGLSFGGMVAAELTRILNPILTIIISSASSAKEIPWYYKVIGYLRLPRIVPIAALKFTSPFTYWLFGATTGEEKILLKEVLIDTDSAFLKWALVAITSWQTVIRPKNIFHIHGTSDKILPINFVSADCVIPKGEHLLVYSLSKTVSSILTEKLGSY